MACKSLMVHLDLNCDNGDVLSVARELAVSFQAGIIGIVAAQPQQVLVRDENVAGDLINADRKEIQKEIAIAKAQFHAVLAGCGAKLEWRSAITYEPLAAYVASQARAADLIITGSQQSFSFVDNSRRMRVGDLALWAGRPVLIIPRGVSHLSMRHVYIGWKNTPEARRAIADALPLLKTAQQVTVLTVASEADLERVQSEIADVAHWLEKQGVRAGVAAKAIAGSEVSYLHVELLDNHCDLLIAGAYGHSRLGELVLGGATQDILLDPNFCVLTSH